MSELMPVAGVLDLLEAIDACQVYGDVATRSKRLWTEGQWVKVTVQVDEVLWHRLAEKGPVDDGSYRVDLTSAGMAYLIRHRGMRAAARDGSTS